MADAGSLGKLPLEIRKKIYAHLLVEDSKISIVRLNYGAAREDNHRNPKHRGKIYNRSKNRWVAAPPSVTSLLRVNKLISQEAGQVLYGCNEFEFEHSGVLESFLDAIGDNTKSLRHISLTPNGILHRGSWLRMDCCLAILKRAKALRTLEISHHTLCRHPWSKVEPKALVTHCKPLLESLKAHFEQKNLGFSILDVIKTSLPPCAHHDPTLRRHVHKGRGPWGTPGHEYQIAYKRNWGMHLYHCECLCTTVEDTDKKIVAELRAEIAAQLGLDIGDEQCTEQK